MPAPQQVSIQNETVSRPSTTQCLAVGSRTFRTPGVDAGRLASGAPARQEVALPAGRSTLSRGQGLAVNEQSSMATVRRPAYVSFAVLALALAVALGGGVGWAATRTDAI